MKIKDICIYNTLAREKQRFVPLTPGEIRMYVCGMTVYDFCHLGHARVMVGFDVITRFLRALGWQLTYVRNITDIDDKILNRAAQLGESYTSLTARFIEAMHEDERALDVLPPDLEPRATEHLPAITAMIGELLERGNAYRAANGDVYYRVSSFAEYGKLSGRNIDELLDGARIEAGEEKENAKDFALWKAAGRDQVGWDAPWGRGRPGWHIECSAMSRESLGRTFDIHGGGPDLLFPHHENEIAQSEAANGCEFVHYWMHVGPLRVDGEKMSKSLGNFFTIRDVLASYPAEVVRYLLTSSHYRSPINYSDTALDEAGSALERLYQAMRPFSLQPARPLAELDGGHWQQRFVDAMCDDFNTPQALAVLFDLARALNQAAKQNDHATAQEYAQLLRDLAAPLALLQEDPATYLQRGSGLSGDEIEAMIAERTEAKRAGDYVRADGLRQQLLAQGIQLEDSRDGTVWRRL